MAVAVRLSSRGAPARMAAASFPIVQTPVRAFGRWYHRVTATNGTVPQPARGPEVAGGMYAIPPNTNGSMVSNSAGTPVFKPQWDIVRPNLPRNAPWAGQIPHGVPGVTYTTVIAQPVQGQTIKTIPSPRRNIWPKGPVAQGRVTTNPRARFFWKVQGGGYTS